MSGVNAGDESARVAVLGGTFDPIHHGHLFAAEEVAARLGLPRVIFMPCGQPPHKTRGDLSPAADRHEMAVLATASNPRFEVSRLEIERDGPSYTIDTLSALRRTLGQAAEVYFIAGADAVLEIMTWKQPDAVLAECRMVAVHRPGYDLAQLATVLGPERAARIQPVAVHTLDISATDLRRRVREGRSLRYLTPEPVIEYIAQRGLYR
jgi:nicotinate-nucleotide adenylyltransferase